MSYLSSFGSALRTRCDQFNRWLATHGDSQIFSDETNQKLDALARGLTTGSRWASVNTMLFASTITRSIKAGMTFYLAIRTPNPLNTLDHSCAVERFESIYSNATKADFCGPDAVEVPSASGSELWHGLDTAVITTAVVVHFMSKEACAIYADSVHNQKEQQYLVQASDELSKTVLTVSFMRMIAAGKHPVVTALIDTVGYIVGLKAFMNMIYKLNHADHPDRLEDLADGGDKKYQDAVNRFFRETKWELFLTGVDTASSVVAALSTFINVYYLGEHPARTIDEKLKYMDVAVLIIGTTLGGIAQHLFNDYEKSLEQNGHDDDTVRNHRGLLFKAITNNFNTIGDTIALTSYFYMTFQACQTPKLLIPEGFNCMGAQILSINSAIIAWSFIDRAAQSKFPALFKRWQYQNLDSCTNAAYNLMVLVRNLTGTTYSLEDARTAYTFGD
jgi:hypothetical protein